MAMHAPMTTNENELLAGYLTQQFLGIRGAAYGLTDEQLQTTPTASALSVGSILRHIVRGVDGWLDRIEVAPGTPPRGDDHKAQADYYSDFQWQPDETGDSLRADLTALIERSEALLTTVDLDASVPVPSDAPWWPKDLQAWSVRWVVLHLIEEVARHAGHADIIRESIDGATMYELLAADQNWPESHWLKHWKPSAA